MNELVVTDTDIIEKHQLAQSKALSAVEAAVECGRMLIKKRKAFPPRGGWMDWLESVGIPESTSRKYVKAAEATGESISAQHANITLADLLGEEKKKREKAKPRSEEVKNISWATVAIECGVMSASAGGNKKKDIQKQLIEIEPSLDFPSRGLDKAAELKMRAACLRLAGGVVEKKEVSETERQKKRRELEIEVEVQDRTADAIGIALDQYNNIAEKQSAAVKAYKGVFTQTEYKQIISALHSDKYNNLDDVQVGRLDRAFSLMLDKKFELCGVANGIDASTLPKTVADLYAMRKAK